MSTHSDKTPGQRAYEAHCLSHPKHRNGTKRAAWDEIGTAARAEYEKFPVPLDNPEIYPGVDASAAWSTYYERAGETPYAWIIDQDCLCDDPTIKAPSNQNAVGMTGPRNAPDELIAALEAPAPHYVVRTFRILDSDGIVYYVGRLCVPPGYDFADGGEAEFAPLENFGTPNAGASEIQYFTLKDISGSAEWVTL